MIEVRIPARELRNTASEGQAAFLVWDRLCKAGIPMPSFSLLRPDGTFKPVNGAMFVWQDGFDTVYEWT
ncbi:MAG: hypothetical protein RL684_705, partial [Pseudomonadota bacterium]